MNSNNKYLKDISRLINKASWYYDISEIIDSNIYQVFPVIEVSIGNNRFQIVDEQELINTILSYISKKFKDRAEEVVSKINNEKRV